eukprot:12064337-Ditylum_brightwellii.AAC.1
MSVSPPPQEESKNEENEEAERREEDIQNLGLDCGETIQKIQGMGLDVDDDNAPAPENVPRPTESATTATG